MRREERSMRRRWWKGAIRRMERATLGAGMALVAWFVERRLLRIVNRKRA
jgi:hypothetical protein